MNAVTKVDRQTVLREKGAEFTAVRDRVMQAAQLPVVQASSPTKTRMSALSLRASRLQTTIEQIGKMIDGARRWFSDTFSLDVAAEIPFADTAIDVAMQSAIAGMNYFIRDANAVMAEISKTQQMFDAATNEQKKLMLADLRKQRAPVLAAPFTKIALIITLAIAALWWLNSFRASGIDEGGDDGDG